jgi:hypothetical protein
MASISIYVKQQFDPGTLLGVYPDVGGAEPPSGAPLTTATVDATALATFTGLDVGVGYIAGAVVSGKWRSVAFLIPAPPATAILEGPAGGVLMGQYPNPGFAVDMATQGELVAAEIDLNEAIGAVRQVAARASAQIVTGSLADGAEAAGSLPLPKTTRFISVQADRPARIRFYSTIGDRDAGLEVARAIGVADADNSGLIAEWNLPTAAPNPSLLVRCNPQPVGSNLEGAGADVLYWRVQNKSGATSTVQVDLVTQRVE